jgi:hypothetical protein
MPRRSRIGGPLPGASEVVPTAQLAVQLVSNLGGVAQLGPLQTAVSVLRVILDTVQVRCTHLSGNIRDKKENRCSK